jgi:polysaccharide pyruvyl transferase WcaK-like protein
LSANARVLDAGKRLILWGASIGPFDKKPAIERWAADQLKQVHGIVVRETRTRDYLAGLGVTENVILMPDPAFALAPAPVELPRDIEHMLTAGAIGLNLSPLLARYRPFPPEWPREGAQWVDTLLAAVDAPFLLIPHVIYPGTANPDNNDAAFLAKVMRLTRAKPGQLQLLHGDDLSSREIKYVISRLKAFVGARTHATIASLSSSVPTLSIGYSVKARGINEDLFGHERWLIDHLTVDPQLLAAKLRELLSEADAVRAHLKSRNATYRVDYRAVRALLS